MPANIITVCEAIKDKLIETINDGTITVERAYLGPVDPKSVTSRMVYVFPRTYSNTPINRGADEWVYSVQVTVIDKYESPGEPTKSWIDDRVEWVQEKIYDALDFSRTDLVFATTRRLRTQTADITTYDYELLERSTFQSDIVFEFREII